MRTRENERLLLKIKAIHEASRHTYGSPRVHAELCESGETCSKKRVARLLKDAGIIAKMKKRFKVTTRQNPLAAVAPNLLQQNFTADTPNKRWVADFTYVSTREGRTHHSDRGSQYTSKNFRDILKKYCIIPSMSGTGNCYDNAAMESFFHTLKTEHTYFESYKTREEAKQSIFEYIEVFYNRKRRHSTLGYVSPAVFEKRWISKMDICLHSVH